MQNAKLKENREEERRILLSISSQLTPWCCRRAKSIKFSEQTLQDLFCTARS